jgi:hypothetical protein
MAGFRAGTKIRVDIRKSLRYTVNPARGIPPVGCLRKKKDGMLARLLTALKSFLAALLPVSEADLSEYPDPCARETYRIREISQ